MLSEIPVVTVSSALVSGILLAAGLLFYLKRFNERTRLTIGALALLLAALVYVLFALASQNQLYITIEIVGLLLFLLLIWLGYQYSFWFIVLGWLLHVLWDMGLYPAETAPYVPQWYAWFCVGFDIVMALYLGVLLIKKTEK
ncbi:DUF6010 family protein [Kaarinaea lacus]